MYRAHYQYLVFKSISILYTFTFVSISILLSLLLLPSTTTKVSLHHLNETFVVSPELLKAFQVFDGESSKDPSDLPVGRSYICVPLFRLFNVELQHFALADDEFVAVSGDHRALGQWHLEQAVPMHSLNKQRTKWRLRLWICSTQRFYYRYIIYSVNSKGQHVLRNWEGQQVARMVQTYELYRPPGLDIFGDAYTLAEGGGRAIETGWLHNEYIVELKFIWRQHISIVGVGPNTKYRLKLMPLLTLNDVYIEVSNYAYNRSSFERQTRNGVPYNAGESIVIFRVTQTLGISQSFRLSIFDEQSTVPLGESYIYPVDLRGSRGILQLPIYASLKPIHIGELTLPYLIVQPWPYVATIHLRSSYQRYWPRNWPTMDVGHRGLGASYYVRHSATLIENTIESFLAVPKAKGDMVMLQVQLTRDYVPIIWHGFGFYTAIPDLEVRDRFDLRYVLIRELSYEQLKSSRVFIHTHWRIKELSHLNVKNVSCMGRIFPKLADVYKTLPITLGVIVDIKWPQLMESGLLESTQSQNKNVYVDTILNTTARHGCGRALILASFDPDICTMLRLKQPAFSVMLLSIGNSYLWDAFMDLRTHNVLQAVNFAESANILGTALHIDNYIFKQEQINLGLNMQQAVFVWGSDLSDMDLLEEFRALDVSGLIYDRIDIVGPANWKRAPFFKAQQLVVVFAGQCIVIGNSTTLPGIKPPKPTIWPKVR